MGNPYMNLLEENQLAIDKPNSTEKDQILDERNLSEHLPSSKKYVKVKSRTKNTMNLPRSISS